MAKLGDDALDAARLFLLKHMYTFDDKFLGTLRNALRASILLFRMVLQPPVVLVLVQSDIAKALC